MKKITFYILIFLFMLTLTSCQHVHNYEESIVESTCESEGYTTYTCKCGDVYNDNFVDKLEHEFTYTYTEFAHTKTCTLCSYKKTEMHTNIMDCVCSYKHPTNCVEYFLSNDGTCYNYKFAKTNGHLYDAVIKATYNGLPVRQTWSAENDQYVRSLTIEAGAEVSVLGCENLEELYLYSDFDTDISFLHKLKKLYIETNGTETITVTNCEELETIIIKNKSTVIYERTFYDLPNLKHLELPSTIQEIEENSFNCPKLETLLLPDSLESLPNYAFSGLVNLKTITLPSALKEIPSYCFSSCSKLQEITIPANVTKINEAAFYNCMNLKTVIFECNLEEISTNAFKNCILLSSIQLPDSVTKIGNGAFSNCKCLETIDLANNLESIGDEAFSECTLLKTIDLPEGLKSIGLQAFYKCNLTEVVLPEGLEELGSYCFDYNANLIYIYIPKGTQYIDGLDGVTLTSLSPAVVLNGADNTSIFASLKAYIPAINYNAVEAFYVWKKVKVFNNASKDDYFVYDNCGYVRFNENYCSVVRYFGTEEIFSIPETVTYQEKELTVIDISSFAFMNTNITELNIPKTIEYCDGMLAATNLKKINVDENNLNFIAIDDVLFNIDQTTLYCFPSKKLVSNYTIPDTVTYVSPFAFYLTNLQELYCPKAEVLGYVSIVHSTSSKLNLYTNDKTSQMKYIYGCKIIIN